MFGIVWQGGKRFLMRTLLVIHSRKAERNQSGGSVSDSLAPETRLASSGYQVHHAVTKEQIANQVQPADAAIFDLPIASLKARADWLLQHKDLPLFWWCSPVTASLSAAACEEDMTVDGVLTSSMNEQELHWALHFGSRQWMTRRQWMDERKQLLSRIEERKWIDMAKGILSDLKGISEAEAYELLRKQAMNERKRMVDVATAIVKLAELLHKNN